MVKKANGKWRMCTNYTDLNKACPKDPYLLPNIDWLVDGASGFALLSFMDAYLGYNQIKMHPQDEAKIAFITDSRTYCYKVMPFGLKNVEATYQHLMDKIFEEIIGTDMEVYVDDMVVKLMSHKTHIIRPARLTTITRRPKPMPSRLGPTSSDPLSNSPMRDGPVTSPTLAIQHRGYLSTSWTPHHF
ncbi:hypothetical protein CR513_33312, partial [Mucuna pruriens]